MWAGRSRNCPCWARLRVTELSAECKVQVRAGWRWSIPQQMQWKKGDEVDSHVRKVGEGQE